MHQEEEKYPEIRNKLLSLPRVKASEDFVTKLHHKINLAEAEERNAKLKTHSVGEKRRKFFGFSGWLIPSLSFGAVAVIAFFVVYTGIFRTSEDEISNNVISKQEKSSPDLTKSEDKLPGTKVPDQIIAGDLKQDESDLSAPPVSPETKFSTDRMTSESPKVMEMLTPSPSTPDEVNEKEIDIETQKREDEVIKSEEKREEKKETMKKSDVLKKDEKKVNQIPINPKGDDKKSDKEGGKIDNIISPFVNPSDKPAKKEDGKSMQEKKKDGQDNKKENKKEDNTKQQKDTTNSRKKEKQQEIIKETPKQEIPKTEVPKKVTPKQENKNKQEQNKNND